MEEIKVGEYVRTKDGKIGKIYNYSCGTYKTKLFGASSGEIAKHSHNPIDLIEVGDYVNGKEIKKVNEWKSSKEGCFKYLVTELHEIIRGDEINSIVTKESFKNAEYRVETN